MSSKIYFYLYIWYVLVYFREMERIQYTKSVDWIMMILMDIYCALGLLVLGLLCRKWAIISPFARFQVLCLSYLLSIVLVFCLAGSFPERSFHFSWKYFTIINHFAFISICCFVLKNRNILPVFITPSKQSLDTR